MRKDHPARATELGPLHLTDERQEREEEALRFRPEAWGLEPESRLSCQAVVGEEEGVGEGEGEGEEGDPAAHLSKYVSQAYAA